MVAPDGRNAQYCPAHEKGAGCQSSGVVGYPSDSRCNCRCDQRIFLNSWPKASGLVFACSIRFNSLSVVRATSDFSPSARVRRSRAPAAPGSPTDLHRLEHRTLPRVARCVKGNFARTCDVFCYVFYGTIVADTLRLVNYHSQTASLPGAEPLRRPVRLHWRDSSRNFWRVQVNAGQTRCQPLWELSQITLPVCASVRLVLH